MLFISGCSGIEVSQDYESDINFNNLKTYTWKYMTQKKIGDVRIDTPLVDDRIRRITENNLLAKGFIKVLDEEVPDFQVAYIYTISRKLYSNPVSTGIGFGFGSFGRHGTIGMQTGTQIDESDEGLLLIDFLEPDSGRVLWRGKSTHRYETHSTPERATDHMNKIIEKILFQFPPGETL